RETITAEILRADVNDEHKVDFKVQNQVVHQLSVYVTDGTSNYIVKHVVWLGTEADIVACDAGQVVGVCVCGRGRGVRGARVPTRRVLQYGMPRQRDAMVMVPPHARDQFLTSLDTEGVSHYVHIEDVAQALEKHDADISSWRSSRAPRMIFQDYQRYAEWVTTPVALYSVYRLVENLRPQDRDLLHDIDWIILPVVNPDGYEYSHTTDRLWRKTRSIDESVSTTCVGVDGNRNFDVRHGQGTPADPCQNTYAGPRPFSEPETGYVRDILAEHKDRVQIFMDIHSHGNYVLFAYGDTTLPPNALQIFLVGAAMGAAMDAIKLPQAGFYRVGNSASVLYPSSGSAQDYGQVAGAATSYTLELPGYGYGFLVPPHYMDHVNEETWQGIAVTARYSRALYRQRYNAASNTQP
ncbi:hypothetical protein HW555_010312, partial [Spodoptera exigua]